MARVSASQLMRSGMIGRGGQPRSAFNLHNQAPLRASYQGTGRSGFTVEFLSDKARIRLDEALGQGVILVRSSSAEALVAETDETKQKMRSYLDAHYTGSEMHGNNHRRVSNAAAQSAYFDDIADQGQLTALIYSKFGYRGEGGFVDFLLLHMRGGTLRPKTSKYLMIRNREAVGSAFPGANIGSFASGDIAMAQSKDREKLFLIRRPKGGKGQGVLLATLLKSLRIEPSLQGLDLILAARGVVFERKFDAVFSRKKSEAGL